MIPKLSALFERQQQRQSEIERRLSDLARVVGGLPPTIEARSDDPPRVAELKAALRESVAHYDSGWQDVLELGAVIKDPQIGLVDFYGRIDGRLVWLCWRFGEESLRYFHELTEGFSGRQPLRPETRERLVN